MNTNVNVRQMATKVFVTNSFLLLSSQRENIVDQLVIVFSKDVCLSEVKLGVRVVIIIIRINELKKKPNDFPKLKIQSYLDIAVIDQFCDHGHAGTKDHPTPLEHDCIAERTPGGRRDWRLGQRAKGVVEGHRLDVQCRQDGLLVRKVRIITCRWNLRQTICNIFK